MAVLDRRLPDELAQDANDTLQTFYEAGSRAGSVAPQSTKVGWTLRTDRGQVAAAFAFTINPQGLTRVNGSRSTMTATRGGFYVDSFGPGASQVQLRQLVASGKTFTNGFYTHREDVARFYKEIYEPATAGLGRRKYRVFFHDHHFQRGFEERVHFPPNALTLQRSVDLHNVWAIDLQMIGLEKYPYAEVEADPSAPRANGGRRYRVVNGDTLDRIVTRVAGPRASSEKKKRVRAQILELNPRIRKERRVEFNGGLSVIVAKPFRLVPGEVLTLPS